MDIPHGGVDGGAEVEPWGAPLLRGRDDVLLAWLLVKHVPAHINQLSRGRFVYPDPSVKIL